MNDAVEEVHRTLKALQPDSDQSKGEEREQVIATTVTVKILEALPLISAVSLLIEISVRIEGIVSSAPLLCKRTTIESGFKLIFDEHYYHNMD